MRLWHKKLKYIYKLLGSRVQLVVNNESLRVKHIIVSACYVLLCVTKPVVEMEREQARCV